ncbi:MAG: hypothetical protein E6073_06055 [Anaerococcus vaginalis]|nr:hypothetical protein [Anaerococcus vaginalis]
MNNIIDVEKKEQKYIRKSIFLLFIFSFLALSLAMIFNISNLSATDFYTYLAILIVIVLSTILTPKITKADNILLMIVNMLFAIGVAMIYRINPSFGKRQLQFYLIGIVLFFLTFFILRTFKFWNKISIFYVIVSVGLFILLFFIQGLE